MFVIHAKLSDLEFGELCIDDTPATVSALATKAVEAAIEVTLAGAGFNRAMQYTTEALLERVLEVHSSGDEGVITPVCVRNTHKVLLRIRDTLVYNAEFAHSAKYLPHPGISGSLSQLPIIVSRVPGGFDYYITLFLADSEGDKEIWI